MSSVEQHRVPGTSEQEPLLGAPGDASQVAGRPLWRNFVLGTGSLVQIGVWILIAVVWGAIFSNNLILFSAHPLFNSAALLFYIQGVLVLQPTHTSEQKIQGTYFHFAIHAFALLNAIAGLVVIEYNKIDHHGTHFESVHAILGLTTYIVVALQHVVGITQFFTPGLYGTFDAKKLYKYHRVAGYLTLILMLATVAAATQTTFNVNVLHIPLWSVIVTSVLILIGLFARVRLSKFGWLAGK